MLQVSDWVSYCLHQQVPGLEFLFFLWVLLQLRLHIHQLLSSIKWWARWTTRSSGLSFLCFSQVVLIRVSLEVEMCCISLSDGNDKLFVDKVHSLSDHHFHIYLHGSSCSNVLESIDAFWGPDSEVKQNSTFDVCGCAHMQGQESAYTPGTSAVGPYPQRPSEPDCSVCPCTWLYVSRM